MKQTTDSRCRGFLMTHAQAKRAAAAICNELFTAGNGETADRLGLIQDFPNGFTKDLGGWCRRAAEAKVFEILAARQR